jgi:hypothetical protein
MTLVPKAPPSPQDYKRRIPVPTGFPPRRVDVVPALNDDQSDFLGGYSLYLEGGSFSSRLARLFPYQSPLVVFPLQAIYSTLTALFGIFLFVVAVMGEPSHEPRIAGVTDSHTGDILWTIFLILILVFILIYSLSHGRRGRRERWLEYYWESFESFARWEAWMRFVGALDLVCAVSTILAIVLLTLKG